MSGALQAVYQNQRSFGLTIGDAYEGGFYAGQISTAANGTADFNLVVGPKSTAQTTKQWKTTATSTTGTSSVIDGPTNSSNMNNASHPAAEFCEGLTIGGFSDWYLPAWKELEVCYYNLKPRNAANNSSNPEGQPTGGNLYAVPSRNVANTSSIPAQTSATIFQEGNAQAFGVVPAGTLGIYWSSTENSATRSWKVSFNNGYQYYSNYQKTYTLSVRAIRRVAV